MKYPTATPVVLLLLGSLLLATGCQERSNQVCDQSDGCSSTGGGGGKGGGLPADCVPSDSTEPVSQGCGVFVSSSLGHDDSGNGSKTAPYATIAAAVANLGTDRNIYLCAESFAGSAVLPANVNLYGGLDCSDATWSYQPGDKSTLSGDPNSPALTVSGTGDSVLHDLIISAPPATEPGGSSIALLVNETLVDAHRCELEAADGANGADGVTPASDSTLDGVMGPDGRWLDGNGAPTTICTEASDQGVFAATSPPPPTCPDASTPGEGGRGGAGSPTATGSSGDPGGPNAMGGMGGVGQTALPCQPGSPGQPGEAGTPGTGAGGSGTLTSAGYTPLAGQAGMSRGTPGRGAGGGGGASSCNSSNRSGPSGGNGGSGGCGGAPGPGGGGGGGGGSFALISFNATVTLNQCALRSGNGGNGGQGAEGQPGGLGGIGGMSLSGANGISCAGGQGGSGGPGGYGGGGLGGPSAAIAYTGGSEPSLLDSPAPILGTAGLGGLGGDGTSSAAGEAGTSEVVMAF